MKQGIGKDIFIIGFAIFAMFFGAGNLIFPPYLGLLTGEHWFLSFLCFIIMDIGLSVLVLLVITKIGKGTKGLTEKLGGKTSALILCMNAICLGPLIAIPRTAATAYEFSAAPFFPAVKSSLFSVIFFSAVVLFCLKQSKVIDIIGTFFAPLILLALIALIVKGILTPLGAAEMQSAVSTAVQHGVSAGYQTMDVMAAMIFSGSILLAVKQKGYTESTSQFRIVSASGALAGLILFIVYGGLAYLGATVSGVYSPDTDRVQLLMNITGALLGKKGTILLGILVCAACLTPAIGLLSSTAAFFEKQTAGKIKYRTLVIGFAALSCIISNFGIEKILALAAPVLNILYPVLVLLLFMGLFGKWISNIKTYRFAAFGAAAVSTLTAASAFLPLPIHMEELPLFQYGFHWILPAALCGILGSLISQNKSFSLFEAIGKISVRT